MKKGIRNYINKIEQGRLLSTKELRELKRDVVELLHEYDDGFSIAYFYEGYDKFIQHINNLENINLSELDKEQLKILSSINQIERIDLKYIMQEI